MGEAREWFERVLEVEPENIEANLHLARLDAVEGNLEGLQQRADFFERVVPDTERSIEVSATYAFAVGDTALEHAFALAEALRDAVAGIRIELNLGGGSFKSQLKRADKSDAEYAVIIGEQEIADRRVGLKPLRSDEDQLSVGFDELASVLTQRLAQTVAERAAGNQ